MEKIIEGLYIGDIRAAQNLDLLVEKVTLPSLTVLYRASNILSKHAKVQ